jgi:hypothetical protein
MIALALGFYAEGFAQQYAKKKLLEAGYAEAAVDDAVFEAWRIHSRKNRSTDPQAKDDGPEVPGNGVKNVGRSIIGFALTVWIIGYGILRLIPQMLPAGVGEGIALVMWGMWPVALVGGII